MVLLPAALLAVTVLLQTATSEAVGAELHAPARLRAEVLLALVTSAA
jgi:hypothetical protein